MRRLFLNIYHLLFDINSDKKKKLEDKLETETDNKYVENLYSIYEQQINKQNNNNFIKII